MKRSGGKTVVAKVVKLWVDQEGGKRARDQDRLEKNELSGPLLKPAPEPEPKPSLRLFGARYLAT